MPIFLNKFRLKECFSQCSVARFPWQKYDGSLQPEIDHWHCWPWDG